MKVQLKIQRYNPAVDAEPVFRTYELEAAPGARVLDCLNRIKWEQDGTLSHRMSCAHGVCGSCAVKINGRCALACQTLVSDLEDGKAVVEPLPSFRVIKDLVVDIEPFLERVQFIRPFLINHSDPPERERLQSPEDQNQIEKAIRCILCACCTAACPVTHENANYLGPSALVQAYRRIFDTRDDDRTARLEQMNHSDAAPACVNHFECTRVCPKEIPVTKSINFIKREIKKALEADAG